jgi:hypothetical protein
VVNRLRFRDAIDPALFADAKGNLAAQMRTIEGEATATWAGMKPELENARSALCYVISELWLV